MKKLIELLKRYLVWLWAATMLFLYAYHKIEFEVVVANFIFMIVVQLDIIIKNSKKLKDMSAIQENQQTQAPKFKENDFVYCAAMSATGNMCFLCCGKITEVYVRDGFINYHILNAKRNLLEVSDKESYRTQEEALEIAKQFFNHPINHA